MGMRDDVRGWAPTASVEELGAVLGSALGALIGKVGRPKTLWLVEHIIGQVSEYFHERGINLETYRGTDL